MAGNVLVERLSLLDIERNVALSNAVGWPDTVPEWRVIHDGGLVFGVRRNGELLGQGALCLLKGAGTIAKMVVSPAARREGIGGAVLDRLLVEARARSLPVVGLVATAPGQPLYEKRGFSVTGEIVISAGSAQLESVEAALPMVQAVEQIAAIERRFVTGSRVSLLAARLRDSCASALSEHGFALATPHEKAARVGPIFAENEAAARALTRSLLRRIEGPVRFDVPGEQLEFRAWLQGLGLEEKGVHREMQLGGDFPWRVPQRFGLATQAWG